jgi:non-ribosomal peptide synthetase component E (peptide arylation enzyme)
MLTFKQYITEDAAAASLSIFDIDDTLFKTDTKVMVKKNGKIIRELTPAEYNVDKLGSDEEYDFSQFRSSAIFNKTAKPVETVFKTAKKMLSKFSGYAQKKITIITARDDLDDKDLFLKTFRKYGFNIDRVFVHRAGKIKMAGPAAKAKIAREELQKGKYTIARMFDDHEGNLDAFLALSKEFPGIKFEAFFVHETGNITRYT